MKETTTAGGKLPFSYKGNSQSGIQLIFSSYKMNIPGEVVSSMIEQYKGKSIIGGFDMKNPPSEGLGYFVRDYGKKQLDKFISPRYASHISAILRDEGLVEITKESRRIVVNFK